MDDTTVTLHSRSGSYVHVFSLMASDNCCKLKKTFTILYLASGKTMCLSSNWSSQDSCLRSSTFFHSRFQTVNVRYGSAHFDPVVIWCPPWCGE